MYIIFEYIIRYTIEYFREAMKIEVFVNDASCDVVCYVT